MDCGFRDKVLGLRVERGDMRRWDVNDVCVTMKCVLSRARHVKVLE